MPEPGTRVSLLPSPAPRGWGGDTAPSATGCGPGPANCPLVSLPSSGNQGTPPTVAAAPAPARRFTFDGAPFGFPSKDPLPVHLVLVIAAHHGERNHLLGGGAVVTRACKGQSTPWAPGRSCPESGSPALRPLAREGLDTPAPALLAQKPILMAPGHPDRFPRPQAGGGRPPPDILQQESRGRWEQHPGPSTHSEFLVHQPVL